MLTNEELDALVDAAEAEATESDGHIDRDLHRKAVTRDVANRIDDLIRGDSSALSEFVERYARNAARVRIESKRRKQRVKLTAQQQLWYEPDAVLTVDQNIDIAAKDSTADDWVKAAAIHQRNAKIQQDYALAYTEVAVTFQGVAPGTRLADAPVVLASFTTEPVEGGEA